jgi:hypothetical protein
MKAVKQDIIELYSLDQLCVDSLGMFSENVFVQSLFIKSQKKSGQCNF